MIGDRRLFVAGYLWSKLAAWITGGKPVFLKAGDYEMRQNFSIQQVLDALSDGRTVTYKVPRGSPASRSWTA